MNSNNIDVLNSKKLIVVLGMHRSGTSAITRGLQTMGVKLGDRLMPAVEGENDKGFWEDIDVHSLNSEILESIDKEWHHLKLTSQNEIESIYEKDFFNRAVNLIKLKINDFPVFGLKNPSLTVLLPFWKNVFEYLKLDVKYIIAIRHPLSVAKSLEKRNGFDIEKSFFLWLTHVINGLSYTNDENRIIINFDNLMQNTENEIKKIAEVFNLEININELEIYKTEFLENNLRHTTYTFDDLINNVATSPLLNDVFATIIELSTSNKANNQLITKKTKQWNIDLKNLNLSFTLSDKLYHQLLFEKELYKNLEDLLIKKKNELDFKNEELYQIINSKSWQITKPLRFLISFFK